MKKTLLFILTFLVLITPVRADKGSIKDLCKNNPGSQRCKQLQDAKESNSRFPGEVPYGVYDFIDKLFGLSKRKVSSLVDPNDYVAKFERQAGKFEQSDADEIHKLICKDFKHTKDLCKRDKAPIVKKYSLGTKDRHTAFCLDPGVEEEKSLVYKRNDKEQKAGHFYKAALGYIKKNKKDADYLIMQMLVWYGTLPKTIPSDAKITEEVKRALNRYNANKSFMDNANGVSGKVYTPICGHGQRLLSVEHGEDIRKASESDLACDGGGALCVPTPEKPCKDCKPTPKNNYCKDPIVCETKSELAIAENCGMTGQYKDIFDWNCLAGDDQFYDDSVFEGITNGYEANYCRFYCREEVETTFPGDSNYRFYAGRFFTIGMGAGDSIWGPISVYGKRTCRSFYNNNGKLEEGVNWNKFIKDLNFVKGKIKSSYEKYKHDLAKQKAGEKSIAEKQDNSPNCVTKEEVKYCCRWDNHVIEEWGKDPCTWSDTQYYECDKTIEYGTFYPHKEHNVKGFRYWDNIKEKVGGCDIPTTVADYAEVNGWIKEQERIMNIMGACERANPKYHLSPRITFNYSSTAFNYGGGDIVLEPQEVGPEELERQTAGGDGTINYIVCSPGEQEHCRDDLKRTYRGTVANKTPYKTEKEITIGYTLPTEGYKYITKSHGSAGKTIGENLKQNGTYMDFPYPIVLPLDFKLQTGNYDLSITYQNIGNQYGSGRGSDISPKGKGWFDYRKDKDNAYIVRGGSNYSGGLYNYACNINIENDILKDCSNNCDHIDKESNLPGYYGCIKEKCPDNNSCSGKSCVGGIDVIYRPIQLQIDRHTNVAKERGLSDKDVAFPSYKSNGRKPGANWSLEDVHRYINCNRSKNVTLEAKNCSVYGDQVYKEKPMYTIKLDPAKILEIRKYNKAQASNGGYADFDSSMKCKQGRNCISSFIHQKYRHYFDSNQSTCLNSTIENFECRYQH